MRQYKYSYSIYKNDFPICCCDTIYQVAKYLNLNKHSIKVESVQFRQQNQDRCKIYSYYDNVDKCTDYSQLYYATKNYEVYRFWSL